MRQTKRRAGRRHDMFLVQPAGEAVIERNDETLVRTPCLSLI